MPGIDRELVGTVRVIRLRGAFVTDEAVELIDDALSGCSTTEVRCVVVNWSALERINSEGLGAIFRGEMEIARQGRHYRNCAFSKFMIDLIPMLKLFNHWNYFETEEKAVSSCPDLCGSDLGGRGSTSASLSERG